MQAHDKWGGASGRKAQGGPPNTRLHEEEFVAKANAERWHEKYGRERETRDERRETRDERRETRARERDRGRFVLIIVDIVIKVFSRTCVVHQFPAQQKPHPAV
jgi:hypothetical protein